MFDGDRFAVLGMFLLRRTGLFVRLASAARDSLFGRILEFAFLADFIDYGFFFFFRCVDECADFIRYGQIRDDGLRDGLVTGFQVCFFTRDGRYAGRILALVVMDDGDEAFRDRMAVRFRFFSNSAASIYCDLDGDGIAR